MHLPRSPRCFVEFRREDTEQSVPERFEQQVTRFPDRIAIKTPDQLLTYNTLNQRANRIARAIREARGDTEEPVALVFTHGAPMIAALLGVLKVGKIVVPLEPAQPIARLSAIVEDSQAGLLVTDARSLPLAEGLTRVGVSILSVDEVAGARSGENLGLPLSPDRLMQIMYTSGSTGRPKGVVQNHRNVLHAVMRYTNPPRVVADDRVALLLSYARVAGMLQIFRALLNGAALFPFDLQQEGFARLADWLAREEITILQSIPSVFRHFAEILGGREQFPHLRLIHLGGDLVAKHDVELYKQHFAATCRLLNNFGATETATVRECFIDKTTVVPGNVVPVGGAVADVDVLLLDEDGQEVGTGQVGEIAVRSRYVALGYWRRPDLTRARFRSGPGGARVYLTGDLGRLGPDGCLAHLGRKDAQVKIRGNRIDVAEIEMALLEQPGVLAVAVAVTDRESGDPSLVAYVVPRHGQPPGSEELRAYLKRVVPEFMVPSAFVCVEALPRTPEGKVDRQALATLGPVKPVLGGDSARPIEAVQRQLAEIWEDILKIHPVGVRDDFFELGGHSLLAVRMMDRIEQVFGRKLPLGSLFGGATIERLANVLLSPETRGSHFS
jgi:amino acid adenylation domain-containing protein